MTYDDVPPWSLIESDPAVFKELIQRIGVKDVSVEELYSMDDDSFRSLRHEYKDRVYGLIFLFKWTNAMSAPPVPDASTPPDLDVFFAKQVVPNACATQAILSVLLNAPSFVDIGEDLGQLKEFTRDFDPHTRGICIGNCEKIRTAHNCFRHTSFFEIDGGSSEQKEDVFHFIAYVPKGSGLYELDGLKAGPTLLSQIDGDQDWLEAAGVEMRKMVDRVQTDCAPEEGNELRFTLLAVVEDRLSRIEASVRGLRTKFGALARALAECGAVPPPQPSGPFFPLSEETEPDAPVPADRAPEELADEALHLYEEVKALGVQWQDESSRAEVWRKENERRRHDLLPFLLCVLRRLAARGELRKAHDQWAARGGS